MIKTPPILQKSMYVLKSVHFEVMYILNDIWNKTEDVCETNDVTKLRKHSDVGCTVSLVGHIALGHFIR